MRLPLSLTGLALTCLLLFPALASARSFRLDGVDPERGPYVGRLTLSAPAADGRVSARWQRWFADGAEDPRTGSLTLRDGRLSGRFGDTVGAAGRLMGEDPGTSVGFDLALDGDAVSGTVQGSEVLGRTAPDDVTPQPPTRVEAKPVSPRNASTRKALAAWSMVPGTTGAVALAANGGRPVVVHLPPGFDPKRPARLVIYLHGHGWDAGPALDRYGVFKRVQALGAEDPQTIFVFPQAGTPPFRTWLKAPGESLAGIEEGALGVAATLAEAPAVTITRRVVDAHSGGGLALANAADSGELRADKLNLIDSAYGSWAQTVARWAARAKHQPTIESWFTNHASQAANNAEAARLAKGRMTVHGVGAGSQHNALPSRYLGTD